MNSYLQRTMSPEDHDPQAETHPLAEDHRPPRRRERMPRFNPPRWQWRRLGATMFAPPWLLRLRRRPLVGYLAAVFFELGAVSGVHLEVHALSIFALQEALVILGIIVVALTWGAGPGLLAVLVGMTQLDVYALFSGRLMSQRELTDGLSLLICWLIGVSICVMVSRSCSARRQAEALATSLRAEQARSEMEYRRLRTLLGVLPAAVAMVDAQGRFVERNPAEQALWGTESPPSELAQLEAYQGWWPDTGKPVAVGEWAIARALTRGETIMAEEVEQLIAGQHKVILHSAAPIRDETGAIQGAAGVLQDITERKRMERELAERAAQLEAILASITDGLIVTDAQGRLLGLNPAYQALLGVESVPTGVTLATWQRIAGYAVLDTQGRPITEAERPVNRIMRGEVLTGTKHVDLLLRTRDGREIYVNGSGAPIRDKAGRLLGAVQVLRDVTDQRRLEQHTHEALRALLAMAEVLVQVQDAPTAPQDADPGDAEIMAEKDSPWLPVVAHRLAELTRRVLACRAVSIVAVEPETALMRGVTVDGLTPEQEAHWRARWDRPHYLGEEHDPSTVAALRAGEPVTLGRIYEPIQWWQERSALLTSLLVPMRVGDALVGILRVDDDEAYGGGESTHGPSPNRTELVRAIARLGALVLDRERLLREREAARARELALRETTQQMDTFVGIASHELKTPLTSLMMSLYLAEQRIEQLNRRRTDVADEVGPVLEQVTFAERQTERLDRLVNDLVDVARVRSGKLELHPRPADLADIVLEALDEQRRLATERTLLLQFPADLRVPVNVDADRIGQVVTNYLTNALKYSPADRPVAVGIEVNGQQARVWVRDEGPGLPTEEQERIWERFHRASGIVVQSGSGIGLGLGLHICRTIIERHHGRVGVESAPGRGSTFWFTVPLASQEAAAMMNADTATTAPLPDRLIPSDRHGAHGRGGRSGAPAAIAAAPRVGVLRATHHMRTGHSDACVVPRQEINIHG